MASVSVPAGRSANRRFRRVGLVGAAVLLTATASAGILRHSAGSGHPAARSASTGIAPGAAAPVAGVDVSGAVAAAPQLSTASIRPLRGSTPGMTVYVTASTQVVDLVRDAQVLSDNSRVTDGPLSTLVVDRSGAEAAGLLAALNDASAVVRGDGIMAVKVVDLDSTHDTAR